MDMHEAHALSTHMHNENDLKLKAPRTQLERASLFTGLFQDCLHAELCPGIPRHARTAVILSAIWISCVSQLRTKASSTRTMPCEARSSPSERGVTASPQRLRDRESMNSEEHQKP